MTLIDWQTLFKLIVKLLFVFYIFGSIIHEYAHKYMGKLLDVKSIEVERIYWIIPVDAGIKDENEKKNLPDWKFVLISISGVLVSIISICIYYKMIQIDEYSFCFYSLAMIGVIFAGIVDCCMLVERFCKSTKPFWKLIKRICKLIKRFFKEHVKKNKIKIKN